MMRLNYDPQLCHRAKSAPLLVRLLREGEDDWTLTFEAHRQLATHQLVPMLGGVMLTHLPHVDQVVSAELLRFGFWEFAESHLLITHVRPGQTVVDVGANIGYYTLILSRLVGQHGYVYAVEPEPANWEVLMVNALLAARELRESAPIAIKRAALSDRDGEAALHVFRQNLGFHSLLETVAHSSGQIGIAVHTLDRLRWGTDQIEPTITRRLDWIKSDIQGAEGQLLAGAMRTLREDRPQLCLEFEPYISGPENCQRVLDRLAAAGYSHVKIFHSNATQPQQIMAELIPLWRTTDVMQLVAENRIGAYGTLWASPDA